MNIEQIQATALGKPVVVHTFSKGFSALNMSPSNLSKRRSKQGPGCSRGSPIRTKPLNPTHNVKRGDSGCFCDDRQNSCILKEQCTKHAKTRNTTCTCRVPVQMNSATKTHHQQ